MVLLGVLLTTAILSTVNGLGKPNVGVSPTLPKEGDNVTLSCNGNFTHENISYQWFHNGNLDIGQEERNWILIGADRDIIGNYSCTVHNTETLKKSEDIFVAVLYTLDAPSDVEIVSQTASSFLISWKLPESLDLNQSTLYSIVYYRQKSFPFQFKGINNGKVLYNLTGLQPATNYEIQLSAVNRNGEGVNSSSIEERTNDSRSSKVENFTATAGLSQSIELSWKKPKSTNGEISGYQICSKQTFNDGKESQEPQNCTNLHIPNDLKLSLTGLGKYSTYDIQVSAINLAGAGEPSTIKNVTTKEEAPMNIRNLTILPSYYNISLSWVVPRHIYGKLRGYMISYMKFNGNSTFVCVNSLQLHCNIRDLLPSQWYTIKITVTNNKFNTSKTINVKTRNVTIPLAYVGNLPPANNIGLHSFSVQLVTFQGPIRFYDVVVKELGPSANLPTQRTNSYTNRAIINGADGLYVAERIYPSQLLKEIVIGDNDSSNNIEKHIASLPVPTNKLLKQDTYYAVFVRGYADYNVYQSTSWYSPVKTKDTSSPIGAGAIAGIVIVVIVVITVVFAVLYVIRIRSPKQEKSNKEVEPKGHTNIIGGDEDPTIPVSLDVFEEHVYQLTANSNYLMSQQYSMISRELDRSYDHSRHQENNFKNRYHNVPAYDETRVILDVVDNELHTDYINANSIDGFENRREYIATQGPLPETLFDFWRMVWEFDVSTIIMLTKLQEKGRLKCAQYWPDTNAMIIKDFVITSTESQEFPDHIVRTFHVTRTAQAIEKVVRQYHFTAWPDFGVPDDPSALLCFIRKVNNWKTGLTPAIIHCSAGVGRTGTYITIDSQIKNARKNKEVNIFNNVCYLRRQRCLMVQTEDQYIFIHNAILAYMESDDTEVDASELNEYINLKAQVDNRTDILI